MWQPHLNLQEQETNCEHNPDMLSPFKVCYMGFYKKKKKWTMTDYKCVAMYVFADSSLCLYFLILLWSGLYCFRTWEKIVDCWVSFQVIKLWHFGLVVRHHTSLGFIWSIFIWQPGNESQRSTIFLRTTSVGHFTNSNCQVLHSMLLSWYG